MHQLGSEQPNYKSQSVTFYFDCLQSCQLDEFRYGHLTIIIDLCCQVAILHFFSMKIKLNPTL